jgi:hypothetical protein
MTKYNHMFDIAFSLESDDCDALDVTPAMLNQALLQRIIDLNLTHERGEWLHACGLCDTYEILPSGQGKYVEKTS